MNATTLKKSVIGVAVLTALAIVGLTVGGGPFSVSPTDTFAKHNPGTCQGYSATTDSSGNYLSEVDPVFRTDSQVRIPLLK